MTELLPRRSNSGNSGAYASVPAGDIGGTPTAPTVPRSRYLVTDNGLFVSSSGGDDTNNDGLSPGAPLATLAAAVAKIQPSVTTPNQPTHRGHLINMMQGDHDYSALAPLVIKKMANLEIRGMGGHGKSRTLGQGGVNIITPVGQVGLTIGYRDNSDAAWLQDHRGVVLRGLHFTPPTAAIDAAATDSSVGLKIIGLSNLSMYDVNVSNYGGASSIGIWNQSALVANGSTGGGTSYNTLYSCAANKCTTGLFLDNQDANLIGFYADGMDDLVNAYLASSTGILCANSGFTAEDLIVQGHAVGIDASYAHSAGILKLISIMGLHAEACGVGLNSNQTPTSIIGGTFDNGNLTGGAAGTTAVILGAGAQGFVVTGFEIGGVGTRYTVDSAASGWVRDSKGLQVYGTTAGRGLSSYQGSAPSGAMLGPAGSGASFGGFATGSTDMAGAFTFTTGTSTGAGAVVTITFHDAFPAGTIPVVHAVVSSTGTQNNTVIRATGNANNLWQLFAGAALTASSTYTVQYAVLGTHS